MIRKISGLGFGVGTIALAGVAPAAGAIHSSGGDVKRSDSGKVLIGSTTGSNIGLDNNEIMARDGSGTAPLHLQAEGGRVVMGAIRLLGFRARTRGGSRSGRGRAAPRSKRTTGRADRASP